MRRQLVVVALPLGWVGIRSRPVRWWSGRRQRPGPSSTMFAGQSGSVQSRVASAGHRSGDCVAGGGGDRKASAPFLFEISVSIFDSVALTVL